MPVLQTFKSILLSRPGETGESSTRPPSVLGTTRQRPYTTLVNFLRVRRKKSQALGDTRSLIRTINSERFVVSLLKQERITGVEVDSTARYPPPRCHPSTRKGIRARISAWFAGPDRGHNIFWLLGPPGSGKSALAQTIAEESKLEGRLGAAIFFSRLNEHIEPSRVILTLVYQLFTQQLAYRELIVQRLAHDPTILEKDIRSQFRELIVEPFRILHARQTFEHPLLIILDGLDQCDEERAQCNFIELISDYAQSREGSPLLWMICSRPEWHLKRMLSRVDSNVKCCQCELSIEDMEAQQDVHSFLCAGFDDIRRRYPKIVPNNWPADAHVRQLANAALGHFSLASLFLKFIEIKKRCDPTSQLDICLQFISGRSVPHTINPLHSLDHLYRQVLANSPSRVRSTLLHILCLRTLCPGPELTVSVMFDILGLDQTSFYRAVEKVHSVLRVPAPEHASKESLQFYHASFKDFVKDIRRSNDLSVAGYFDFVADLVRLYNAKQPSVKVTILLPDETLGGYNAGQTASTSTRDPDEDFLEHLQTRVLCSKEHYKSMLQTEPVEAQCIVDRLQKLLSSPRVADATRQSILTALLRLSAASGLYPQQLRLHNIQREPLPVTAGQFGEVWRGQYQGRLVCLKIFKIDQQSEIGHALKSFTREAIVWSQLEHPNLLQFHGIYHISDDNGRIGLVSPWMKNGNLQEYLRAHPGMPRLPLVYDIVAGLQHLHQNQVVHGDLKGLNILIKDDGSACLADFGLSAVMNTDVLTWASHQTMTQVGGTVRWMAPEIIEAADTGLLRPSCASDVYSLASVMFEVFTGKVPYYKCTSNIAVIAKVICGIKPDRPGHQMAPELTDRLWGIMEDCWSDTPSSRPTTDQVLEWLPEHAPLPSRVIPAATFLKSSQVALGKEQPAPTPHGAITQGPFVETFSNNRQGHIPSESDVFTVRNTLVKRIPQKLVDAILNEAEYWPTISGSCLSSFLVRSNTLGDPSNGTSHICLITPQIPNVSRLVRTRKQTDDQLELDGVEVNVERRIKTVAFKLASHDQGWGGDFGLKWPYRGSWTWFEAEIWRPINLDNVRDSLHTVGSPASSSQIKPMMLSPTERMLMAAGYYRVRPPSLADAHRDDAWLVQRNLRASNDIRKYTVIWSDQNVVHHESRAHCDTYHSSPSLSKTSSLTRNSAVYRWDKEGKDEPTPLNLYGFGNGVGFVQTLQPGDRVVIIARARFPGWCNHIYGQMCAEIRYTVV